MPSTYAHYRMGKEIHKELGLFEKAIIEENLELFLIGLHGPDILFYYKPLHSNEVNRVGYGTHERPGYEFFENAADMISMHQGEESYLAYIYGCICHFALDVTCHGYIDEKIEESGISHTEIEVEFDRELMIQDGFNPITHPLTEHIVPTRSNARVIRHFYHNVSTDQVKEALEEMIYYNKMLIAPSKVKRQLVYLLLKMSGNYKEMHGLLVNFEKNPDCIDSTEQLMKLYKKAKSRALSLIENFTNYLNEKEELDELYQYTFGTRLLESLTIKSQD